MFLIRDGTHMKSTLREWGYVIGRCEEMLSDVMEWGVSECFGSPIFIFFIKENWICILTRHHTEPYNIVISVTSFN